jgi:hypothetical protein
VHVGDLWFVDSAELGDVRYGRPDNTGNPAYGRDWPLSFGPLVIVFSGKTAAIVRPAPEALSYFRLYSAFSPTGADALPRGDTGYTFAPCPSAAPGPDGQAFTFYLPFSIQPGREAAVEVWTSPNARPAWLTFSAPAQN